MRFRLHGILPVLMAIAIAVVFFHGTAHGQFTTLTVNVPITSPTPAPVATGTPFTVSATVSPTPQKVEFYRNDVLIGTDSSYPFEVTQSNLGQDTYTYRARAYDSNGDYMDSSEVKLTVKTPFIFKMGETVPAYGSLPSMPTSLGYRGHDHSDEIQRAVDYIGGLNGSPRANLGGGTLFLPCTPPNAPTDPAAVYQIWKTIKIPSDVTIAAESSEAAPHGRCLIFWVGTNSMYGNPGGCNATPLAMKVPMFKVEGATNSKTRIRLRDLSIRSMSAGPNCYPRIREGSKYFEDDLNQIATDNTVAVMMEGDVTDVILENLSIVNFSVGVKAESSNSAVISDVKIRGVQLTHNTKQLSIDAAYAGDWDVQNFNITGMYPGQNGVDIINAGRPSSYTGSPLKFLQLNCNGSDDDTGYCVNVVRHGGLYFKQLHHEGIDKGFKVDALTSGSNAYPIVVEGSVMSGEFRDASMKLYTIGNHIFAAPKVAPDGYDNARMRFYGDAEDAEVADCGDSHGDWTDTNWDGNTEENNWRDLRMLYTHTERSRNSFFFLVGDPGEETYYNKAHRTCPAGLKEDPEEPFTDINKVGGEYFNTGVMPVEDLGYGNRLDETTCNPYYIIPCDPTTYLQDLLDDTTGTIYVDDGPWTIEDTITIPSGRQIVGAPGVEFVLDPATPSGRYDLFKIVIPVGDDGFPRAAGTVLRDLKLSTSYSNSTGLALVGEDSEDAGSSSDMHFSGLTIEGFNKGMTAAAFLPEPSPSPAPSPTPGPDPMIDGVSWKNMDFVNNQTSVEISSSRASNWNVGNLTMKSNAADAIGWNQLAAGHSIQNVGCEGASTNPMTDCIRIHIGASYINDMVKPKYVTNAVTLASEWLPNTGIYASVQTSTLLIRNSDLRSSTNSTSKMNVLGKSFITSMNNKYENFNVGGSTEAEFSRVTYCGDNVAYSGLDDSHPSYWFGMPMKTVVQCGPYARPWDDPIIHGGEDNDVPLAGDFTVAGQDDYVIYRPGLASDSYHSHFIIKPYDPSGQSTASSIQWGLSGSSTGDEPDVPMIAHFHPNTKAQIVIWRPSNGAWWAWDPNTSSSNTWYWGNGPTHHDRPFVGNFIDESASLPSPAPTPPSAGGNKDELAVYRPATGELYIINPRNGRTAYVDTDITDSYSSPTVNVQVADFLGLGYDQVALVESDGTWNLFDPRNPSTSALYTMVYGTAAGDIPLGGKYYGDPGHGYNYCAQIGFWQPATQEFRVKNTGWGNCPDESGSERRIYWGSTESFTFASPGADPNDEPACAGGDCTDDIVFTMTSDGVLRRPTAYRRTNTSFEGPEEDPYVVQKGMWWIHDTFPETP